MSGSFKPIDVGEWSDQTYITPSTKLFKAIAQHDRRSVQSILKSPEFDPARRDHVGRTPLHVAILCGSQEIACDIVDVGVRVTARLADGKAALHLAAQMDQVLVVQKLLQKSDQNKKIADKNAVEEEKGESQTLPPDSSTDDWSSHDSDAMVVVDGDEADSEEDHDGDVDMGDEEAEADQVGDEEADKEAGDEEQDEDSDDEQEKKKSEETANPAEQGELPEDKEEEPDIIDINMVDWDLAFPPLFYAVVYASLPVINALLEAGADSKLVSKAEGYESTAFHSLTLLILRQDRSTVASIAERLITAGASASEADDELRTIFHHAVAHNQHDLVKAFLKLDKNARTLINFPLIERGDVQSPIVSAVVLRQHSMVALLLALGATLDLSDDDASKALEQRCVHNHPWYGTSLNASALSGSRRAPTTAPAQFESKLCARWRFLLPKQMSSSRSLFLSERTLAPCSAKASNTTSVRTATIPLTTIKRCWIGFEVLASRLRRKSPRTKDRTSKRCQRRKTWDLLDGERSSRVFSRTRRSFLLKRKRGENKRRAIIADAIEKFEIILWRQRLCYCLVAPKHTLSCEGRRVSRSRMKHPKKRKTMTKKGQARSRGVTCDTSTRSLNTTGAAKLSLSTRNRSMSSFFELHGLETMIRSRSFVFRRRTLRFLKALSKLACKSRTRRTTGKVSNSVFSARHSVQALTIHRPGITTFTLAILGRRWDTARLILAIAAAQYDEKEKVFSLRGLGLDG